jgi:hypothetical protein
MAKSKARFLSELLGSTGLVKKSKSALAGADEVLDLDVIPSIPNSKLTNSSISIAGHSTALGSSVSLNTGDIGEHTNYLYFTNARARGSVSVSGDLAYNSTTGVISFTERTDAEVRGLVSAGGNLSYNSSTGAFSYTTPTTIASLSNHDTADLAEGTNLYFTTARARSAISATGSLSYNSTTGVMSFTMPAQNTSNITEGSNLYFTNARADARITAALIDEDNMSSNSATRIPSQQSVKAYVDTEVAGIVDSAPGALNTLNELAAALGDDANFSTTVTNSIATKLPSSSYTAADVLTKIKTVDGTGSGLDADLLDGMNATDSRAGNTIVKRQANGYMQAVYVNTTDDASSTSLGWLYGQRSNSDGYHRRFTAASIKTWGGFWASDNDGSGSGLDADTVDGLQAASFLRSDTSDTIAAGTTYTFGTSNTEGLRFTNSSYSKSLYIGGWTASNSSGISRIRNSNDNLHLDSGSGGGLYLNHYSAGNVYARTNLIWHAGNDGSGSGLDADLLDGQQGSYYALYDHFRSLGTTAFTGTASTAGLISEMEGDGAFDSYTSAFKTSWSYAGNFNMSDAGRFTETAGTSFLTWTDNSNDSTRGNITVLAIAPNTGGSAGKMFVYNDQGSGYSPGWREIWTSMSDGSGSGLDADLLDGNHASAFLTTSGKAADSNLLDGIDSTSYARSDASWSAAAGWKQTFYSGAGGVTFGANHYSMGVDVANGSWSNPNYSDLIIGYHTGIRMGGGYSGIRFYNNSPTTDTNNTGNGNGSEALLMTIGGGGTATSGAHVTVENNLYVKDNLHMGTGGNDGRFYSDANGRTAFADGDFYIQNSVGNYYNYATNQYIGDSSGDNIYFRGNTLSGSGWSLTGAGILDLNGGHGALTITNSSIISAATSTWTGNPGAAGKIQYHSNRWYIVGDSSSNRIVQFRRDGSDKSYIDNNGALIGGGNWYSGNDGSGSGLDADLLDGVQGSSFLRSDTADTASGKITMSTGIARGNHHVGHLEGSYNNVAANSAKTNPIYTIGSNYNPSATSVSGMYGIGYAHSNLWGTSSGRPSGWGQYIVENGTYTQVFSVAGTWSLGQFNRNGNTVWDAGNDGSGSGLDADTCDGQHLGTTANPTFNTVRSPGANADVRLSVWSGTTYGIGMTSGVTLGYLNDYAMTFCMNNDNDRGFWWGYSGQGKSAGAMSLTTNGRLWVTSHITSPAFYYTSDRALKKNIKPIENAFETINKLQGVTYTLRETEEKSLGFIAQDVEQVLPEFVKGEEGQKTVNYGQMVALLTEAMKEQQAMIVALQEEVQELKNAIK